MPRNATSYWLALGENRAADAGALQEAARYHGAVYLIGYAVEASAKALCLVVGNKPPTSGRLGHDLNHILILAGVPLNDLQANERSFVIEYTVDMRYEVDFPMSLDPRQAFFAGSGLSSRLAKKVKRSGRRRRRRNR